MSTTLTNANLENSTAVTPPANDNSTKVATTAWSLLGFAISLAANGYIKLPTWLGGLIIQWLVGTTSASSGQFTATETWPVAFATSCLWAQVGIKVDANPQGNDGQGYGAYLVSFSATQVVANVDVAADNPPGQVTRRITAIGVGY